MKAVMVSTNHSSHSLQRSDDGPVDTEQGLDIVIAGQAFGKHVFPKEDDILRHDFFFPATTHAGYERRLPPISHSRFIMKLKQP